MDEKTNLEITDGESWDDIDFSDIVSDGEETETGATAEANGDGEAADGGEANQPTHDEAEQTGETETEPTATDDAANQSYTYKVLGQEQTISRNDPSIPTLLQKGTDYDRIRQKHEDTLSELTTAKDKLAFFEQIAGSRGETLDQFIDEVAAEQLAAREGIDPAVALGRVQIERERKQLEAEKAKLAKGADEQALAEKKRQDDITAFQKEYPDVFAKLATDKNAIPATVWEDVNKGESLVAAYAKYERAQLKAENDKLKAEAEQIKQKQINKSRSTGSQSTKGAGSERDLIDMLWDEN